MADRIKTVSTYGTSGWGPEVPIGADASNVDVTLSNNTKTDLQTVLGATPSGTNSSITDRINGKVSISGGDVADTVVSKHINNYDSSTDAGDDILTDTAATMSTNTSTLWSRFNLFRKKVSNNFANYFLKSNLVGLDPGVGPTGNDNTVYTTSAINNYLSNVIGYTSASAPEAGDVATQLSTLNSNFANESYIGTTITINDAGATGAGTVVKWGRFAVLTARINSKLTGTLLNLAYLPDATYYPVVSWWLSCDFYATASGPRAEAQVNTNGVFLISTPLKGTDLKISGSYITVNH